MSLPETFAQEGLSFQSGGNRFGDYSHMSLDPDGKTFWFTGEFIGNNGSRRTKIFSFSLEDIVSVSNEDFLEPALKVSQNSDVILVNGTNLSDGEMYVQLYAVNGQEVATKIVNVASGEFSSTFDKSTLSSGVYLVRVGKESFQRVQKIAITK